MRRSTSFLSRTREAGPSSDIAFPPDNWHLAQVRLTLTFLQKHQFSSVQFSSQSHLWQCRQASGFRRRNLATRRRRCSPTRRRTWTEASLPAGGHSALLPTMESLQSLARSRSHVNSRQVWTGRFSASGWVRTWPRVRAVELRLRGVSEDGGSHAVEAVLLGVLLQPRLFRAHQVVVAVASRRYQLRDTELRLQQWEGRPITCQWRRRWLLKKKVGEKKKTTARGCAIIQFEIKIGLISQKIP